MLKLIGSSVPQGSTRLNSLISHYKLSEKPQRDLHHLKPTLKIVDLGMRSASLLPRHKSQKLPSKRHSARGNSTRSISKLSSTLAVNSKNIIRLPNTPVKKDETVSLRAHFRSLSGGYFPSSNIQNPSFAPKLSNTEVIKKVQRAYCKFLYKHNFISKEKNRRRVAEENTKFSSKFVIQMIFRAWKGITKKNLYLNS